MNVSMGKLYSPDAEDLAKAKAQANKTAAPPLPFTSLISSVAQARQNGAAARYDSVWLVMESLINEVARLREIIDKRESV